MHLTISDEEKDFLSATIAENELNNFRDNFFFKQDNHKAVNTTKITMTADKPNAVSANGSNTVIVFAKSTNYVQSSSDWYRVYFSEFVGNFAGLALVIKSTTTFLMGGF